jgi:hypothetical protein
VDGNTSMTKPNIRAPFLFLLTGGVSMATAYEPWNSPERAAAKFWIGVGLVLIGAVLQYREIRRRHSN